MKRHILTIILALAIMLSFCTPTIMAEAASKKTVYVITRMYEPGEEHRDYKFTYNKKGQVIKCDNVVFGNTTYTYKKNKIRKSIRKSKKGKVLEKDQYSYDKKGRLSRVSIGPGIPIVQKYSYNKKNQITKCSISLSRDNIIKYSWKKGQITTINNFYNGKSRNQYKYYKNGLIRSLSRSENGWTDLYTYVYTMEENHPIKRVTKTTFNIGTEAENLQENELIYECKQIKIDKKYLKQVKAQQRDILHKDIIDSFLLFPQTITFYGIMN